MDIKQEIQTAKALVVASIVLGGFYAITQNWSRLIGPFVVGAVAAIYAMYRSRQQP